MLSKVRASIKAADALSEPRYAALCELALTYARQIDAGVKAGGQDATKALYLGPHLLKTLGEMGLSLSPPVKRPVGRPPKDVPPEEGEGKEDELTRARKRHGRRGA